MNILSNAVCQESIKTPLRWQQTWVTPSFVKMGKIRGGDRRSQGCTGRMRRPLLLARGKFHLAMGIGSGHGIFAGRSPTCLFAERSAMVLFRSAPGDAAARPLAPPASPSKIPFPPVLPFSCVTRVP
jgi:hypothetical protein